MIMMILIICVMLRGVMLVLLRLNAVEIDIRGGYMGFRFCIFNEDGGGGGYQICRIEKMHNTKTSMYS